MILQLQKFHFVHVVPGVTVVAKVHATVLVVDALPAVVFVFVFLL